MTDENLLKVNAVTFLNPNHFYMKSLESPTCERARSGLRRPESRVRLASTWLVPSGLPGPQPGCNVLVFWFLLSAEGLTTSDLAGALFTVLS